MSDAEPTLSGLAEIGANFVDRLSLRVAAGKCGNGGRIAADIRLRADNGGETNGHFDNDRLVACGGMAHWSRASHCSRQFYPKDVRRSSESACRRGSRRRRPERTRSGGLREDRSAVSPYG